MKPTLLKWLAIPLLACGLAAGQATAHHVPGAIRIGAILTTTGTAADLGKAELKGLHLGVDEINAAGGLFGHKFEVIPRDDEGNAAKAAAFASEFSKQAEILIGGSTTETSLAIATVAEKQGIPFISLAGARKVASPPRKWVFKMPPSEVLAAAVVIADMGRRGIKRVALLSENSEFGQAGRYEVQILTSRQSISFRRYGVALGSDLAYNPDMAGVAQTVAKLRAGREVDAVLVFGAGIGPALVTRELRRAGFAVPIYQSHGSASREFLKLAGEAGEGLRVAAPALLVASSLPETDARKARLMKFTAAYEARYNETPSSFAGYAYDALMLARDAMRRANVLEESWIRVALENTQKFVGLIGTYDFFRGDHEGPDDSALVVLEVSQGGWRLVD